MEPTSGRLGQPEAGTSVGTHITTSRIRQSCTACLQQARSQRDSVPVECPRGPLSMCVTTGTCMLYVRYVLSFFFCIFVATRSTVSIVKLRLIDTSTTVTLHVATTHPCGSDNTTHPHNVPYVLRKFLQTQNTLA